jgi:hypothetical protein
MDSKTDLATHGINRDYDEYYSMLDTIDASSHHHEDKCSERDQSIGDYRSPKLQDHTATVVIHTTRLWCMIYRKENGSIWVKMEERWHCMNRRRYYTTLGN